jgi:hypothetical protein
MFEYAKSNALSIYNNLTEIYNFCTSCNNNLDDEQEINIQSNEIKEDDPKHQKDLLSALPDEILDYIIKLSDPRVARCTILSKKFQKLTNDQSFWRDIAKLHNITLENGTDPKIQVVTRFIIEDAVILLKPLVSHKGINLTHRSRSVIELKGGVYLVPNQEKIYPEALYSGIAVYKETTPEGEKWFLHLCPGAGNNQFNDEDFNKLMPIAIAKLQGLKIKPDYLATNIGYNPGNTMKNFSNWQQTQQQKRNVA